MTPREQHRYSRSLQLSRDRDDNTEQDQLGNKTVRSQHPQINAFPSFLFIKRSWATALLKFYDYPHPFKHGKIISGYDKHHAFRTAQMCAAVASELGYSPERIRQYQVACLLHDLGRAGLDQRLFGKIWTWAKQQKIPTRPREWRSAHPETPYGQETKAFLRLYANDLARQGIPIDQWTKEQIEMRLGFARRLRKQLRPVKPRLKAMGITWASWMELIMLYYYYPEKLDHAPAWIKQLGEILVACEQLEAYSNHRRGRDYYARSQESFVDAFRYLAELRSNGIISRQVLQTIRHLTTLGPFIKILTAARGGTLSAKERRYLQTLSSEVL